MTRRSLEDILKDLRKDENKFMVMQPPGITCFFTEAISIDISNKTSSQETKTKTKTLIIATLSRWRSLSFTL